MVDLSSKIASCKSYASSLNSKVKGHQQCVKWFYELCDKLSDLLLSLAEQVKHAETPIRLVVKDAVQLYLLQLIASISVLIQIFTTESDEKVIVTEARTCMIKQLCNCLDGLEDVLLERSVPTETEGFVKFMDTALDKLEEIDLDKGSRNALMTCSEARKIIEEVLCHGMSIAQVSLPEDCNAIKGGSREVLNNLESLSINVQKQPPNIAMCNLFVDSCCDKLCDLERKVNKAVLRLSLKVFSECLQPLEDLHRFCSKRDAESEDVLDELIAEFDLHVDRMIQVGLFAVTCSTDVICTIKMKSCLVSLEALEGELVPAMQALYMESSAHNVHFAMILKNYWVKQATTLKKYIYRIIDPFAFCQVTYEVIKDINDDLEERFRKSAQVDKSLVKPITRQARILSEMLMVSMQDSPPQNKDTIKKYLNDVINVTIEIDAAAEQLLNVEVICKDNIFRVFKRCKIQENLLRKLLSSLGQMDDKEKSVLSAKVESKSVIDNHCLDHIVSRGQQILKDRSVLSKTPMKNGMKSAKGNNKNMPLCRLVHLRNMQFSHSRVSSEASSFDLQITDILNNFTKLSASLNP